jgi:hypothetical protein
MRANAASVGAKTVNPEMNCPPSMEELSMPVVVNSECKDRSIGSPPMNSGMNEEYDGALDGAKLGRRVGVGVAICGPAVGGRVV